MWPGASPARLGLRTNTEFRQHLGRPDDARPLYQRALAIYRQLFDDAQPDIAIVLANLASLCTDVGDHDQAARLHAEALAMARACPGDAHPLTRQLCSALDG